MAILGENILLSKGIDTAVDHSANQYRAVKEDGTLAVVGEVATAIMQNDPDGTVSGGAVIAGARVGISRWEAGAAITAGVKVAPDANGLARTAVSADHVVGIALSAAGGATEIIFVQLSFGGAPLA